MKNGSPNGDAGVNLTLRISDFVIQISSFHYVGAGICKKP